MELYQELLDKYPGSIFVPDARKNFRILRLGLGRDGGRQAHDEARPGAGGTAAGIAYNGTILRVVTGGQIGETKRGGCGGGILAGKDPVDAAATLLPVIRIHLSSGIILDAVTN